MEEQAHHRYYNSVRWDDSYARTATVAACRRARSVAPVMIELVTLSRVVHQKLSFHRHAEMLAGVALQLLQALPFAVKWQWEEHPGKLVP